MGTSITAAQWLNLGINVLLPIAIALVTTRVTSGAAKAVALVALSALSGFMIAWLDAINHGLAFDLSQAGFTALTGLVVAIAGHFGFWKPVGLTGSGGWAAGVGVTARASD